MFKKVAGIIVCLGLCISVFGARNARTYALGEAWMLGDIVNATGQGWWCLNYPDVIQSTYDMQGLQKPGATILTKSFSDNFAAGISLNTFDRITGGSVLSSTSKFLNTGNNMAEALSKMEQAKFPNLPQYHLGIKIGDYLKIGGDGYYEAVSQSVSLLSSGGAEQTGETMIRDYGGKLSARLGIGGFALNGWYQYVKPEIKHEFTSTTPAATDIATGTPIPATETKIYAEMNKKVLPHRTDMGLSGDVDLGDLGWAIACAGWSQEAFRYQKRADSESIDPATFTKITSHSLNVSPELYKNDYLYYFAAYTPKLFDDFTLGFEYQGQYHIKRTLFPDSAMSPTSQVFDTIRNLYYNRVIILAEKTIKVNKWWCTKFTPRGALAYEFGPDENSSAPTIEGKDGSRTVKTPRFSTLFNGKLEGAVFRLGAGYTIKRFTFDVAFFMEEWDRYGFLSGPPSAIVTATLDLHK